MVSINVHNKIHNVNVCILKVQRENSNLDKCNVVLIEFFFPYDMQMRVGSTTWTTSAALQLRYTIYRLLEVFSCLALVVLTLMHSGSFLPPAIYWEDLYISFIQ